MLLLVDLDGVVYRGAHAVPGVPGVLAERVAAGDTVLYCTNNSSRHRSEYLAQLESLGAPVRLETVFSSARATAVELASEEPPVRLVMVVGGTGLVRELQDAGILTVPATERGLARGPEAVVVGVDWHLTYARLTCAAQAVRSGARLIATNRDPIYPGTDRLMPGAGSIVAALEVASGHPADLAIGKPAPYLFEAAAREAGCRPDEAVVIGDGLMTDIAAANAVGARSVLMLTGVSTRQQAEAMPPGGRPTAIAADAAELRKILGELARAS